MTLLYDIHERPRTIKELLLYALQQLMSVFVATVLIANICGTPVSSCLFGAGLGTIVYQICTKFSSPMFISSCGATCSAVIGALALSNGTNYLPVVVGGFIIFATYAIFATIVKSKGIESINKIFPPAIVGAVTIVIGLNLAAFIPTYVQVNGAYNTWGVIVALLTMAVVALSARYFKGFLRTIPFLIGLIFGYIVSCILTITGIAALVDFTPFRAAKVFVLPEFTFFKISATHVDFGLILQILALFVPVAICALLEHYSDHKVLGNMIGTDLTKMPGLHRTLLGDGLASWVGTIICGLPNTSYGESIATTGFSRVASVGVIFTAALMLIGLSFIYPVQAFIRSVPACVFGGCAMILYGYIAASGLKTIISSKTNLESNRNLVIVSVILTVGVSGIWLFSESFSGVSLAMVLGVILNLVLRQEEEANA